MASPALAAVATAIFLRPVHLPFSSSASFAPLPGRQVCARLGVSLAGEDLALSRRGGVRRLGCGATERRAQGEDMAASAGAEAALPKLYYFKGRGKAEIIRFALGAAGAEWEDCFLRERAAMVQLLQSGKLLYDQVPMLELPSGQCIVQTNAILRYVAETHGLHGQTPEERAQVDVLVEGANDLLGGLIGLPFQAAGLPPGHRPQDGLQTLMSYHVPRYFGAFERHLAARGSAPDPWMVGKRLTVADTSVLRCVEECVEWLGAGCLQAYPRITRWREAVLAHPQVKSFMSGPHRQPPPANPDVARVYCREVGVTLGRG